MSKKKEEDEEEIAAQTDDERVANQGSSVGRKLSETTTLRVVMGILLMLFVLPFMTPDDTDTSMYVGFALLTEVIRADYGKASGQIFADFYPSCKVSGNPDVHGLEIDTTSGCYELPTKAELIFLQIKNASSNFLYETADWKAAFTKGGSDELRYNERRILTRYKDDSTDNYYVTSEILEKRPGYTATPWSPDMILEEDNVAVFSLERSAKQAAGANIILMIFVIFFLVSMSLLFGRDAHHLVVQPIENMVKQIADMMDDPLGMNQQAALGAFTKFHKRKYGLKAVLLELHELPDGTDEVRVRLSHSTVAHSVRWKKGEDRIRVEMERTGVTYLGPMALHDVHEQVDGKVELANGCQFANPAREAGDDMQTFLCFSRKKSDESSHEGYETAMLMATVSKIQKLLRVGFGGAGGEIVAGNLAKAKDGGSEKIKVASTFGLRVYGIWGFCIIEDFNDILVALDEDIMVFVNLIAKMVHAEVQDAEGAVNKNIGEAFLLTWKTPPTEDELKYVCGEPPHINPTTGMPLIDEGTQKYYVEKVARGGEAALPGLRKYAVDDKTGKQEHNAADYALKACLAIAEAVQCRITGELEGLMSETCEGKSILQVLREKVNPHFSVHMGVGLNYGWAIEGAIGSEHKVDASYLSPNVNTAARLETANHQFGTKMLISQIVVDMMSPACQKALRCVDCVRPKGVATGINIYTCDLMHLDDIFGAPKRLTSAENRKRLATLAAHEPLCARPEFQTKYKQAFELYFAGDWTGALPLLEECKALTTVDNPENGGGHGGCNFEVATGVLIDTIQSYGNSPPKAGEKGYKDGWIPVKGKEGSGRALTAK